MIIGFDLDGTLINSIPLHAEAFVYAGKKTKVKITKEAFFQQMSTTTEDILRRISKGISDEKVKRFVEVKDNYLMKNMSRMQVFPDTVSTLHELGKEAKIIIISNSTYHQILTFLETTVINPLFFDVIVGRDLVEHPKPFPDEIFIAEKIEHHKLDYYVGDSIVDILTGRRAGVKTIAVATGFNTRKQLEEEKPFKVIDHLSQLLDIIK